MDCYLRLRRDDGVGVIWVGVIVSVIVGSMQIGGIIVGVRVAVMLVWWVRLFWYGYSPWNVFFYVYVPNLVGVLRCVWLINHVKRSERPFFYYYFFLGEGDTGVKM